MKVYVLTAYYGHSGDHVVLGVFDKPKTARLNVDKRLFHSTKNKWKKDHVGGRYYKYSGTVYYINEFKVIKGKLDTADAGGSMSENNNEVVQADSVSTS